MTGEVNKSCSLCKFYDGCCCMYDYRIMAILDEEKTANNCAYFSEGAYDEDELEKSNFK
ncbi:hypothetical protein PP175_26125 (plasmid) [Aneurinibacillus sp. Ricciae_BoGa-3]|uniref:hypothetical protein n=1 Tax=Aneurinibacillus sp. Ricciae_BoGa-3 TaxID=3022697 RepID=UPI0023400EEC|nr:hypothetical protein [Aneurinibacillus sp. Ricciae_BoGa-3]WCK57545.1 hypothetical protein PP175_26125 [Aneurinibacillus sp. Ricciae_BoGa-3]